MATGVPSSTTSDITLHVDQNTQDVGRPSRTSHVVKSKATLVVQINHQKSFTYYFSPYPVIKICSLPFYKPEEEWTIRQYVLGVDMVLRLAVTEQNA
jgi:hypothetical protein